MVMMFSKKECTEKLPKLAELIIAYGPVVTFIITEKIRFIK